MPTATTSPSSPLRSSGARRRYPRCATSCAATRHACSLSPARAGPARQGSPCRQQRTSLEDFPDGTFFAPLATLTEAELFLPAVAETLGVRETGDQPLDESLKDYLSKRRLLLLLDNFEQVLGAAPAVTELLAAGSWPQGAGNQPRAPGALR